MSLNISTSQGTLKFLPRYFPRFYHELLESVEKLESIYPIYFESEHGQKARGYLNKWLDKDSIHLAGITADVLYIYKLFHYLIMTQCKFHCHSYYSCEGD